MSFASAATYVQAPVRWCVARAKPLIFCGLYILFSLFALVHFLASSHLGDRYDNTRFESMLNGTAARPFVYRALVPAAVRAVQHVTPNWFEKHVNKKMRHWMTDRRNFQLKAQYPWIGATFDKAKVYPRLVATLLIYMTLCGYMFMMFRLGAVLFPDDGLIRWCAPLLGALTISAFNHPWQYIYDIPVLFLSAACLYAIAADKIKMYLVFFLLACFNRETILFMVPIFALFYYGNIRNSSLIALCAVQLVMLALVKLSLADIYAVNRGFFLEPNLARVLMRDVLAQASHYKMIALCVYVFLFTYRWPEKPALLKYALLMLPFMYIGYVFHGNPGEYRVFFDLVPALVLLATHTLVRAAGLTQTQGFYASLPEK